MPVTQILGLPAFAQFVSELSFAIAAYITLCNEIEGVQARNGAFAAPHSRFLQGSLALLRECFQFPVGWNAIHVLSEAIVYRGNFLLC